MTSSGDRRSAGGASVTGSVASSTARSRLGSPPESCIAERASPSVRSAGAWANWRSTIEVIASRPSG